MMRSTISSNALFEGAHTGNLRAAVRLADNLSLLRGRRRGKRGVAAERAICGFEAPASHGMTRQARRRFRTAFASRLSKKRLRSSSWPLDARNRVQYHAQKRENDARLARAGRTLDQRDWLLRVPREAR